MLPAPPPPAPSAPPEPDPAGGAPAGPRRGLTPRRTAVLLGATAVAGCTYVALVDPNESSWYPQCPFRAMTGWDCPGCGITRALRAVVTGDPIRALDHNLLFLVALVVGAVWYLANRLRARRCRPPLALRGDGRWWAAAGIALVGAFWVVRNLPWGPGPWLAAG